MGKVIPFKPRPKPVASSAGAWGSADHHKRYSVPRPRPHRHHCSRCRSNGARGVKATHAGMANGLCLMIGCEWHVSQWVKMGR